MTDHMRALQGALSGLGHPPGPIDGIWGARTRGAVESLLAANGRRGSASQTQPVTDLPWMAEGKRLLGRHEARDRSWLMSWLRSDGRTLGDPAKLPWCGDFVETCLRLAQPAEPFPGALGQNPYWARNWLGLGVETRPTYGAVLVFERGSGGHVGFCVGASATDFYVLGGNQSNAVTVAPLARSRLLGARWPRTFAQSPIYLPPMTGGSRSTNEA